MKIHAALIPSRRALTTSEMVITMAIFSLVMVGVIELHLFGLHQNQLVESKLGASNQARTMFNRMIEEIRGAKMWQIGDGSEDSFTPVSNGARQEGSALQLYPTASTNTFVRYFFDADERQLRRTQTTTNGMLPSRLVAGHLTSNVSNFSFQAEDINGHVKTDLSYKCVIRVVLEFSQFQFPVTYVGEGYLYNSYKMEFRVTPHSPDGA